MAFNTLWSFHNMLLISQKYPNWWNIGCFWEWCKIDGSRKLNFLVLTPAYPGTWTPYITRTAASKLMTMWDILVIIFHEEWLMKIMSVSFICMGHDSTNWRYLTSIEDCSCYQLLLWNTTVVWEKGIYSTKYATVNKECFLIQWFRFLIWFNSLYIATKFTWAEEDKIMLWWCTSSWHVCMCHGTFKFCKYLNLFNLLSKQMNSRGRIIS